MKNMVRARLPNGLSFEITEAQAEKVKRLQRTLRERRNTGVAETKLETKSKQEHAKEV